MIGRIAVYSALSALAGFALAVVVIDGQNAKLAATSPPCSLQVQE